MRYYLERKGEVIDGPFESWQEAKVARRGYHGSIQIVRHG